MPSRSGWMPWALVSIVEVLGACKGSSGPAPVRVYPPDGGFGRTDVTVTSASLTENGILPAEEEVDLTLAVANVGDAPISDVALQEGRIETETLDLALAFSPAAAVDASPILPGETRTLVFTASVVPLGVCTSDLELQPNPHSGLVTIGFTVVSSAGGHALSDVDVPVTCQYPGDVVLACDGALSDACAQLDPQGAPVLQCTGDWDSVTRDTSLCGTGATQALLGCPAFAIRVLTVDGVRRAYYYDQTTQALVAVTAAGSAGPDCLGGPTPFIISSCPDPFSPDGGVEQPACPASMDGGPTMGGGDPSPDGGTPPEPPSDDGGSNPPSPDGGSDA